MDYAVAVNEEIRDLFAAARTWCRSTNRTCRRGPRKRGNGLVALNRAGHYGKTAVHICFGYAAIIQSGLGYSFLPELAGCSCQQISETAQSKLDCAVLEQLPGNRSWSAASICST